VYEVHISPQSIEPFAEVIGPDRFTHLERRAEETRSLLSGRVVWNVSSTSAGGGVAELLRSIIRYVRGVNIDARWLVIEAKPEFFRVTKRIHNALHASAGDGSPLGPEQAALYRQGLDENRPALEALVRGGDVVICHDPQTAGLVPALMRLGAEVIWRGHIGHEGQSEEVERAWEFLRPFLEHVPHAVFTRPGYAPPWLHKHTVVMPPTFDPLSTKNRPMAEETVRAILVDVGLVAGPPGSGSPVYVRGDGSERRIERKVETVSLGPKPSWETPLVTQVSRWDAIKDPLGVLEGFANHVVPSVPETVHLVLAGPDLHSVTDDPEGERAFEEVESAWKTLPDALKRVVHLALLPMKDLEENAAIVNALQRHAAVVVQKSLEEGFGLTVTEAMWKSRPVVASAVGGIQDQIRDGVEGLLLRDPKDRAEFGAALRRVLTDDALARRLGEAAHARVVDKFLPVNSLLCFAELIEELLG
jgi:trehalose synthase